MTHKKNKVREHQNVGDDFKYFSYFHIQIISHSACFQPFGDSCVQVVAAVRSQADRTIRKRKLPIRKVPPLIKIIFKAVF